MRVSRQQCEREWCCCCDAGELANNKNEWRVETTWRHSATPGRLGKYLCWVSKVGEIWLQRAGERRRERASEVSERNFADGSLTLSFYLSCALLSPAVIRNQCRQKLRLSRSLFRSLLRHSSRTVAWPAPCTWGISTADSHRMATATSTSPLLSLLPAPANAALPALPDYATQSA